MRRNSRLAGLLAALLALAFAAPLGAQEAGDGAPRLVVVGTAPVAGVYYPAGGAICNLVNRARAENGLRCLAESTEGSADNLRRLRDGTLDFALVQSDWQYLAVHGNADEAPFEALRSVLALHGQAMTVLVRPDSGIVAIDALPGHRIALGPEGSGLRMMAEALLLAFDWDADDFQEIVALDVDAMVRALCDGRVEAVLLPVSHPNGAVALAAAQCGALPIAVTGRPVETLLADWPFYSKIQIPAGLYPGVETAVATYGPRATLVTRADLPDPVVYDVARAVMTGLGDLALQHPALAGLEAPAMIDGSNSAELHPGALRYYREQGWK